jgi:hypothetical protein
MARRQESSNELECERAQLGWGRWDEESEVGREVGTCSDFKRGPSIGFTQRRDMGTTTSTCMRTARAGERLKEGRGLPGEAMGSAGQRRRAQRAGEGASTGVARGQRARASAQGRAGWHRQVGPTGQRERGGSRRAARVGGKAEGKWISKLLLLFLLF